MTRYYLSRISLSAHPVSSGDAWDYLPSPIVSRVLRTSSHDTTGDGVGDVQDRFPPSSYGAALQGLYVLEEGLPGGVLAGTLTAAVACRVTTSSLKVAPRLRITVVSPDGLTVRGVLVDVKHPRQTATSSNFLTHLFAPMPVTPVTVHPGDLLVLALGHHGANTHATSDFGAISKVGASSSAADIVTDETDGRSVRPWVQIEWATPPAAPGGPVQTAATETTLTMSWSAPPGTVHGYDVSLDGATWADVGLATSHAFTDLDPGATYTVRVRAYNASGTGPAATGSGRTVYVRQPIPVRVYLGEVEVTGDAFAVQSRRGGTVDGATTTLEGGTLLLTVDGTHYSPTTHPETRPGRPIRVRAVTPDGEKPVAAGTISRSYVTFPDGPRTTRSRLVIEARDVLGLAGELPAPPAVSGSYRQRLTAALAGTGLPLTVTDTAPAQRPDPLPSDATNVLDLVRLIRDTMHGQVHASADDVIVAVADRDRSTVVRATLTDDPTTSQTATVIHYTDLVPLYDSASVVNVFEVTTAGGESTTVTDPDSIAQWGPVPGRITVQDGDRASHAARYMAQRDEPVLTAAQVTYNASKRPRQAAALNPHDVVRVVRDGLLDALHEVVSVSHHITADRVRGLRWTVTAELWPLERVPNRWTDVPPAIRWTDVPPALTWNDAATWRP